MNNEKGQLLLVLILIMVVALGIGLSVVQKSLVDVSTSTKVEQSSRAFSAAEAGIEKYFKNPVKCTPATCKVEFSETGSKATVEGGDLIPATPNSGTQQDPLELPKLAKEDIVQVWLADYTSSSNPPPAVYIQDKLDVYWGNSPTDQPAIELTFVYYSSGQYLSAKRFFDPDSNRASQNSFTAVSCSGNNPLGVNNYQCYKQVDSLPSGLMLVRVRFLYNTSSQSLAVQAVGNCGVACSLPPQKREITSTGVSGETQRKVSVFRLDKVVPHYFDYAIFSAGEISK